MKDKPEIKIMHLLEIMAQLRDPETGCPWDIEQDFNSILPYTLEEAYEVADAILRDDMVDLVDELGDLLLQVVFHAQMAKEADLFDFSDVVDAISTKMIRRHPHIFGDEEEQSKLSPEMVRTQWAAIKAEERAEKHRKKVNAGLIKTEAEDESTPAQQQGYLQSIPLHLPALMRALKISQKVANIGFDWPNIDAVFAKLEEEEYELKEAIENQDQAHIEEELGDLLFVITNLARKCSVDPEMALQRANHKFINRFHKVEQSLAQSSLSLENAGLEDMEAAWKEVKKQEKTQ